MDYVFALILCWTGGRRAFVRGNGGMLTRLEAEPPCAPCACVAEIYSLVIPAREETLSEVSVSRRMHSVAACSWGKSRI